MSIPLTQLPPGDPRTVDAIVSQLKSKGIFDQLRKECLADVDTKPAFLNLRQRVDGQVKKFLGTKVWKSDINKNQLRDGVRKNIQESGILDAGIDAIINQVVNPKIKTLILPYVETTVYQFYQIEPPKREIKDYDIQHQMYIEPPPAYPYGSSVLLPYPPYADNKISAPKHVNVKNLVNPLHHLPITIEPVVSSESEISVGGKSPLEESQTQLTSDVLPMETDAISSEEDDILSRKSPTANKGKQPELEDVKMDEDNAVDSFDTARGNSDDVIRAVEKMNLKENINAIIESVEIKDPDISKASTGLLFDRQSLDSISSNSSGLSFSPPAIKKASPLQNNDSKSVDKKSDEELRSTQSTPLIDEKSLLNESINSSENSKTWAPYTLPKDLSSAQRITIASFGTQGSTNEPTSIIGGTSPVSTDNSQDSIGVTKPHETKSSVLAEDSLDSKIIKSEKSEGEVTSSSTTSSSPEPSKESSHTKGKSSQSQSMSKHRSHSRDKDGHKHGRSRSQKTHSRSHSKSKHDDHSSHKDKDKHHRRDKDDDKDRDKYSTPKGHHHGSLNISNVGKSTSTTDSSKEKKEKSSEQHKSHSSSHSKHSSKDSSSRRDSRHNEKHSHSSKSSSKDELKSESKTSKDSKNGESSSKSKSNSIKLKDPKSDDSNSSSQDKNLEDSKNKIKENKVLKHDDTFILQLARASKSTPSINNKSITKMSKEEDKNLKGKENIQDVKEINKSVVGTISDKDLKGEKNIQDLKESGKSEVSMISDKNLKGKENIKVVKETSKFAMITSSDKNLKGKENIKDVKETSKSEVGLIKNFKGKDNIKDVKETRKSAIGTSSDKNLKGKENIKDVKETGKSEIGTSSDKNLKGKENIQNINEINKSSVNSISDKNLKGKENIQDVKVKSKPAVGITNDKSIKGKENIKNMKKISKSTLSPVSAVKSETPKNKDQDSINKSKMPKDSEIVNVTNENKKSNTPRKKMEPKSTDSKKKRRIVYDSSSSSDSSSCTSDSESNTSSTSSDVENPVLPTKKKRTMGSPQKTRVVVTQSYSSDEDNGNIVLKKITIPVFSFEKNDKPLKEKKNILNSNKKPLLMKKKKKISNNLDIFGNSSEESEFEGFDFPLKSIKKFIQPRSRKTPIPVIEPLFNSDSSDMDLPISHFCKTPKIPESLHDFEGFGESSELDNHATADQKLKRYLAKFSTASCIGLDDIFDAQSNDDLEDATVFVANRLDLMNEKECNAPVVSLSRNPIPIVRIEENSVGSFASDNDSGQSSMDTREPSIFPSNDYLYSENSTKVTENSNEINNVSVFTNNSQLKDLSVQSTSESSIDSISTTSDTYFIPKKQIICKVEEDPTHESSKRKLSESTGSNDTTLLPISKKRRILNAVRSEMEENKAKDDVIVNSYTILTPEEDRISKDYEVDLSQGVTAYCPLSPSSDSSAEDLKSKNQNQVATVEELHQ